jgi:plastocyanin
MKRALQLAVTATLAVLTACGGSDREGAGDAGDAGSDVGASERGATTVVLQDIAFKPEQLGVKAGETVTWRFEDRGIPHNVVADDGSFKSDLKDSGTFQHTFDEAGTFGYRCTVHPGMNGSVKVS